MRRSTHAMLRLLLLTSAVGAGVALAPVAAAQVKAPDIPRPLTMPAVEQLGWEGGSLERQADGSWLLREPAVEPVRYRLDVLEDENLAFVEIGRPGIILVRIISDNADKFGEVRVHGAGSRSYVVTSIKREGELTRVALERAPQLPAPAPAPAPAPLPPPPAPRPGVNGKNIVSVDYQGGIFRRRALDGTWIQRLDGSNATNEFRETLRDDTYLLIQNETTAVRFNTRTMRMATAPRGAALVDNGTLLDVMSGELKLAAAPAPVNPALAASVTRPAMLNPAPVPAPEPVFLAAPIGQVNGRDVTGASYAGGSFKKAPDGRWGEYDANGRTIGVYGEQSRDDWSVYLYDPAGHMTVQIDLYRKRVVRTPNGGPRTDGPAVTFSTNAGMARTAAPPVPATAPRAVTSRPNRVVTAEMASRTTGMNLREARDGNGWTYRQTGPTDWVLIGTDGRQRASMAEVARNATGVTLLDAANNTSYELVSDGKKLRRSVGDGPMTDVTTLVSTIHGAGVPGVPTRTARPPAAPYHPAAPAMTRAAPPSSNPPATIGRASPGGGIYYQAPPIRNQQEAGVVCTALAKRANGAWTTEWQQGDGTMSSCSIRR